jgi:HlyD family secretion protein
LFSLVTAARPLRRRSRAWIFWLVALIALAGGGARAFRNRSKTTLRVRTAAVTVGRVRDLVSSVASGRVAARREASIRAEIAGRVLTLHHRRGERVTAGEPLVTYDTGDLRTRVRAAETAVALARAQIAQSEASALVAERNATRARVLSEREAVPRAEAETLAGQAEVAARAVAAARAGELQGSANVQVARDAVARGVVRAPFDAVVVSTHVEEGEVTAPGAPMMVLADTTELHVDVDFDEADLGRIAVGLATETTLDAFLGERFSGTVTEIAPAVTQDLRGNRAVSIRASIPRDARLRVGMSADVDVVVATRDTVLNVPPTAVMGRGTDRAVYLVEGGVVRRRPIDVGITTWEAVEVTRGLRAGDRVVVTLNVEGLADGVAVTERPENGGR